MEFLKEYWYIVENVGVPILAFVGGISFFSLNFYAVECMELSEMKTLLKRNGNLKNYKAKGYLGGLFNPISIFYIFTFLPNADSPFYENEKFNEQVRTIKSFRKYYSIVFPIVIILTTIGIALNETVMK